MCFCFALAMSGFDSATWSKCFSVFINTTIPNSIAKIARVVITPSFSAFDPLSSGYLALSMALYGMVSYLIVPPQATARIHQIKSII